MSTGGPHGINCWQGALRFDWVFGHTMKEKPILYVKQGCPWCIEAEAYLKGQGISYHRKEVRSDPSAMQEMVKVSGQSKAPTMKLGADVLADFGVEELIPFLKQRKLV